MAKKTSAKMPMKQKDMPMKKVSASAMRCGAVAASMTNKKKGK